MNQLSSKETPGAAGAGGFKQSVQETTEQIKSKAGELGAQARQTGEQYAGETKARAAERIEQAGETLRETTERFEREHDPNLAHYTRLVADKLEDAAHYIRDRDFGELRRDAESFARRHSVVFFGGMFIAGMAAARFLKASFEEEENKAPDTGVQEPAPEREAVEGGYREFRHEPEYTAAASITP